MANTFTPGPAPMPRDPLALDQPKSLGPLLSAAWMLWRGQPSVFVVTAALVVIPIEVFVVGVFGHGFYDPEGQVSQGWSSLNSILIGTLGTSLVTATHARSVVALAEKRALTTESALKLGLAAFGPVFLAALLYFATVCLGVIALIVGALIAATYGVFTTQIVALERLGASEALSASWRLVRENGFWRTLGYLIVLSLFAQIGAAVINAIVVGISVALGEPSAFGIVAVIAEAVTLTAVVSWTALVNTLLYFSWKSESRLRAAGQLPPRGVPIDAGQGVSFVKPDAAEAPEAPSPPSPESPAGPSQGPPVSPPDFPYDDIPPRRPQD